MPPCFLRSFVRFLVLLWFLFLLRLRSKDVFDMNLTLISIYQEAKMQNL